MTAIVITAHAASRYVERIAPGITVDQAREAIRSHSAAILAAHAFGCWAVLTGCRAKLVLGLDEGGGLSVVTVEHAHGWENSAPRKMRRRYRDARLAKEQRA